MKEKDQLDKNSFFSISEETPKEKPNFTKELTEDIEPTNKEHQDRKSILDKQSEEKAELEADLAELKVSLSELEASTAELETSLEQLKASNTKMKAHVVEMKARTPDMGSDAGEWEDIIEEREEIIRAREDLYIKMTKFIPKSKDRLTRLRSGSVKLEDTIRNMELSPAEWKEVIEELKLKEIIAKRKAEITEGKVDTAELKAFIWGLIQFTEKNKPMIVRLTAAVWQTIRSSLTKMNSMFASKK